MGTATRDKPLWQPKDSRVYWFAQLEVAISAGDFNLASRAARELNRLGVEVRYPRKRGRSARQLSTEGEAE